MEHIQLTATSILALFETNAIERVSFVEKTVEAIESGEVSVLKIHLQIKAMEDIITSLTSLDEKKNKNVLFAKRYRKELLNEADTYGKKFDLFNAKFSVGETGTKYDYSICGDDKLINLLSELDQLKAKVDARQKFLQNIPEKGITELDEETGEAITIYRPKKTSTTAVSVSLK